jgi:hypothetical protein
MNIILAHMSKHHFYKISFFLSQSNVLYIAFELLLVIWEFHFINRI